MRSGVTPEVAAQARARRERIAKRINEPDAIPTDWIWHYPKVDGIGSVIVSAHAGKRAKQRNLTRAKFEDVLMRGADHDAELGTINREKDGVVLVIKLDADRSKGDAIVVTIFFRRTDYNPLKDERR